MTEGDWQSCSNPHRMLQFLTGKATDRQFRLFACACCRRASGLLVEPLSRKALNVFEQFADGTHGLGKLRRACTIAHRAGRGVQRAREHAAAALSVLEASRPLPPSWWDATTSVELHEDQQTLAWLVWRLIHDTVNPRRRPNLRFDPFAPLEPAREPALLAELAAEQVAVTVDRKDNKAREYRAQSALIRCIFGNPFRAAHLDPEWLTVTVTGLARGIYQERAFDDLPILADALEDAGCANADILDHCRSGGEHVLGCWVLDSLMGKS